MPKFKFDGFQAQNGKDVIANTTGLDGYWWRLHFIEATVFLSLSDAAGTYAGDLSMFTFAAGTTMDGDFTRITLVSGAVCAYKYSA